MIWVVFNIMIGLLFLEGAKASHRKIAKSWIYKVWLVLCAFLAYIFLLGDAIRIVTFLFSGTDIRSEAGSSIGGVFMILFAIPYVLILKKYLKKSTLQKNSETKKAGRERKA